MDHTPVVVHLQLEIVTGSLNEGVPQNACSEVEIQQQAGKLLIFILFR